MRIRKHAKISSLLNATSSAATVTPHICQLNQSRWDVMSLSPPSTPTPPPPPQVDRDCFSAVNGSSNHSILASQSEFEVGPPQEEYSGDFAATDKAEQPKNEQIILCSKTDGKSWQCRREAAKGNSLCEHHLSLIKSYNLANSTTKKPEKPESGRRPRPKKVSSDPHEYYYYSGFGPRWGKKRGENRKNNGSNEVKKVELETELHTSMPSRVEDEEFSYIEDDDDDEESRENGKKRARKPIKARSLKSLM